MNKIQPSTSFWHSVREFLFKPSDAIIEIGNRHSAELVAWISLLQTAWFLLAIISILVVSKPSFAMIILISIAGISLLAYFLSRTHWYGAAAWILVILLSVTGYAFLFIPSSNNILTTVLAIISLAFVVASAILSVRSMSLVVIINSALGFLMPVLKPEFNQIGYFITIASATLIGILLAVFSGLRNSVENQRLDEVRSANQALQSMQNSLEQRVRERTAAAESARSEAEAARQTAETQMWFTAGQALLAEQMRGEQELTTLANNITAHLCRYTGAQAGVLFLAQGEMLSLIGRYAYIERPGAKTLLRFGEGLVGQAARENKVILLNEFPPDAPRIASSLGESLPRQILISSLEADGQIFGVLEIATLAEFTLDHQVFIARAAESIAIAFRTAQSRERIASLLSDSQRQAEELQAQEEELRAINEELQAQAENLATRSNRKATRSKFDEIK